MSAKAILLKDKQGNHLLPLSKSNVIELVNATKTAFGGGDGMRSVDDALTYLNTAYLNMQAANNISDAAYGVQVTVNQVDGKVQKPELTIVKGAVEADNNNFVTGGDVHNAIAGLTGAMHFVGAVASTDEVENPQPGDVCIITDSSKEFVYTENGWVELGDEALYSAKADTVHKIVTSGTDKDYATVVLDATSAVEGDMLTYTMSYSVEVAVQAIADATEAKQGLADAYDVKSYMGSYMDASIKALDTEADVVVASVSEGVVTLTASIAEADGIIAKGSGDDIVLAKVATTGDAADVTTKTAASGDAAADINKILFGAGNSEATVDNALINLATAINTANGDAITSVQTQDGGYVKLAANVNDNKLSLAITDSDLDNVATLHYDEVTGLDVEKITLGQVTTIPPVTQPDTWKDASTKDLSSSGTDHFEGTIVTP